MFYRVIQPEMKKRVLCNDKDFRLALFFISLLSTILNLMQKDMIRNKLKGRSAETFDFSSYSDSQRSIDTFENFRIPVIKSIMLTFKQLPP